MLLICFWILALMLALAGTRWHEPFYLWLSNTLEDD